MTTLHVQGARMQTALIAVSGLVLLVNLSGCAAEDSARRLDVTDTTWIQKGQTTQKEVVAQYGQPELTMPSAEDNAMGEYALYGYPPLLTIYTKHGLSSSFEPRPRGPFPQVYLPPLETLKPQRGHSDAAPQFWVRYDEQKVVDDFGFGTLPCTD